MFGFLSLILFFTFLASLAFAGFALLSAIVIHPILAGVLWFIAAVLLAVVWVFSTWPSVIFWLAAAFLVFVGIVILIAFLFWVWSLVANDNCGCEQPKKDCCNKCHQQDCKCFEIDSLVSIRDPTCCDPCNKQPPQHQPCHECKKSDCGCEKPPQHQPCNECKQPECKQNCRDLASAIAGKSRYFVQQQEDGRCIAEHQVYDCTTGRYQTLFTGECNAPVAAVGPAGNPVNGQIGPL